MAFVLAALLATGSVSASKVSFKHTTFVGTNPSSSAGCGNGTTLVNATFSTKSGTGFVSDNASSLWCSGNKTSRALEEGMLSLAVAVPVTSTGPHTIVVSLSTRVNGSVNYTAGTCLPAGLSSCRVNATAFIAGSAFVKDLTTGVVTRSSNGWSGAVANVHDNIFCLLSKCHSSGPSSNSTNLSRGTLSWSWYWNRTTMSSNDSYVLYLNVWGGAFVNITTANTTGASFSGARAYAVLDGGGAGYYAIKLASITIAKR